MTLQEDVLIFLWEASERPLLRDVGRIYLKYDFISPTVIGHVLVLIKDHFTIKRMLTTWHPYTRAYILMSGVII